MLYTLGTPIFYFLDLAFTCYLLHEECEYLISDQP